MSGRMRFSCVVSEPGAKSKAWNYQLWDENQTVLADGVVGRWPRSEVGESTIFNECLDPSSEFAESPRSTGGLSHWFCPRVFLGSFNAPACVEYTADQISNSLPKLTWTIPGSIPYLSRIQPWSLLLTHPGPTLRTSLGPTPGSTHGPSLDPPLHPSLAPPLGHPWTHPGHTLITPGPTPGPTPELTPGTVDHTMDLPLDPPRDPLLDRLLDPTPGPTPGTHACHP